MKLGDKIVYGEFSNERVKIVVTDRNGQLIRIDWPLTRAY